MEYGANSSSWRSFLDHNNIPQRGITSLDFKYRTPKDQKVREGIRQENKPNDKPNDKPNFQRRTDNGIQDRVLSKKTEYGSVNLLKRAQVTKTNVLNLNLEHVKPQRAGVIIYTVVDRVTYFGLGLDAGSHDLTDFGGGVSYHIDGDVVRGALREFSEETLGIFEKITVEDIARCPVIYDDHNLIIFIHMAVNPEDVSARFLDRHKELVAENQRNIDSGLCKKKKEPEVCSITWLTWSEFQEVINSRNGILFGRVQRFLSRAGDLHYLL